MAGRAFTGADFLAKRHVVIVNQQFADDVFAGRNPIGRRIRYVGMEEWNDERDKTAAPLPWLEIIGVAPDLGMSIEGDSTVGGFYLPLVDTELTPVRVAMRVKGNPVDFAPRLRALAADVDPSLRLYDVMTLDRVTAAALQELGFWFRLTVGVSVVALTLSLAGIYAVMAFTVSRRTREIGIRVALGSDASRVVLDDSASPVDAGRPRHCGGRSAHWLADPQRLRKFPGADARRSGRRLRGVHDGGLPARLRRPDASGAASPTDGSLAHRGVTRWTPVSFFGSEFGSSGVLFFSSTCSVRRDEHRTPNKRTDRSRRMPRTKTDKWPTAARAAALRARRGSRGRRRRRRRTRVWPSARRRP